MYSTATVKRARTICANVDAAKSRQNRAATAKKAADKDAWMLDAATPGQVRRIRTVEAGLGLRQSTPTVIGTGGEARTLWRSLVADAQSQGWKVNRKTGELYV